jgi:hypothetical protein
MSNRIQQFWMVIRIPQDIRYQHPSRRHDSYDEALAEACRLAHIERVPFGVLSLEKSAVPTVTVTVAVENPTLR